MTDTCHIETPAERRLNVEYEPDPKLGVCRAHVERVGKFTLGWSITDYELADAQEDVQVWFGHWEAWYPDHRKRCLPYAVSINRQRLVGAPVIFTLGHMHPASPFGWLARPRRYLGELRPGIHQTDEVSEAAWRKVADILYAVVDVWTRLPGRDELHAVAKRLAAPRLVFAARRELAHARERARIAEQHADHLAGMVAHWAQVAQPLPVSPEQYDADRTAAWHEHYARQQHEEWGGDPDVGQGYGEEERAS